MSATDVVITPPASTSKRGCACGRCRALERVRFFPRQLVTAEDLNAEEEYFLARLRRHNVYMHGFGIVCGLGVTVPTTGFIIHVDAGYALSPSGDEVLVSEGFDWDLKSAILASLACPPSTKEDLEGLVLYVGVRPLDCPTRAVRVAADRCSCDDGRCEFSRIRETFACCASRTKPKPYLDRDSAVADWQKKLKETKETSAPPCPPCAEDDCVVVAELKVSEGKLVKGDMKGLVLRPTSLMMFGG